MRISISSSQTGNIIDVTLHKRSDGSGQWSNPRYKLYLRCQSLILMGLEWFSIRSRDVRSIINLRYTSVFKLPLNSLPPPGGARCYHAFSRQRNWSLVKRDERERERERRLTKLRIKYL